MTREVINDHAERAKGRLLEQYRERPNINALVTALVNPLQEIELQLKLLSTERWLANAKGRQLDRYGESVGEERNSRDDAGFKRAIYCRIFINNGGGTPEDIISAIDFVYSPKRIDYTEIYPASFQLFIHSENVLTGIKPFIRSVSPAGVGDVVISYLQEGTPFTCSSCGTESFPLTIASDDGCSEVSLQGESDTNHILEIAADTIVIPEQALGFGEIIITESNLTTGAGSNYMIDENTTLVLIASLEDFTVQGGGRLAGVIEND